MNIVSSALGYYEVAGDPADADVVIGHSFGVLGDVNYGLARFIINHAEGRPIVADRMLVDVIEELDGETDIAHTVEGPVSNAAGKGVGTWGTLVEAKDFMEEQGLQRPLMVAQANHIGRVIMQAKKLGMDAIVPADLPNYFDATSAQIWTRSLALWLPREVLGSAVLRLQKKL